MGTTEGKYGTEFEQLVGKLFQMDGDPGESHWFLLLGAISVFYPPPPYLIRGSLLIELRSLQ